MKPNQKRACQIIQIGLDHFHITADALQSRNRTPPLADIRQAIMAQVYRSGMSSPATGQIFRRDHSNVLHAVKVIPQKIAKGGPLAEDIAEFQRLTSHLLN